MVWVLLSQHFFPTLCCLFRADSWGHDVGRVLVSIGHSSIVAPHSEQSSPKVVLSDCSLFPHSSHSQVPYVTMFLVLPSSGLRDLVDRLVVQVPLVRELYRAVVTDSRLFEQVGVPLSVNRFRVVAPAVRALFSVNHGPSCASLRPLAGFVPIAVTLQVVFLTERFAVVAPLVE